MAGGKTSKYKAKGGVVSRMGGGKTSKYRCYAGHILYLHTDKEGNFLWN
jgi:hypothetical protein